MRVITCQQCGKRRRPAYDDALTIFCRPCLREIKARIQVPDAEATRDWLLRVRQDERRLEQALAEGRLRFRDYGGPKVG